jgi:ribosomal protein L37AE/L43A
MQSTLDIRKYGHEIPALRNNHNTILRFPCARTSVRQRWVSARPMFLLLRMHSNHCRYVLICRVDVGAPIIFHLSRRRSRNIMSHYHNLICTACYSNRVEPNRAKLGYRTCLTCGEKAAKQVKHTVVPMPKSNYIAVTDLSLLKGLNSSHKGGSL